MARRHFQADGRAQADGRTRRRGMSGASYLSGVKMRIVRTFTALLALIVAAAGLAGCGTSDGLDSLAKSIDLSNVTKDDAIAAMLPDSVKADGVLTIGSETTFPPAEFLTEDNKTAIGYEMDLAKALGLVFGLTVDVQSSSFDSIIPSVGSKYDLGISGFTITNEREESVNFVSIFSAGMVFVTRQGNPKGIDPTKDGDLCGRKVAVQQGTAEEDEITEMNDDCLAAGRAKIDVQPYPGQTSAATAVVSGKADVMDVDSPVGDYAVKQTEGKLEVVGGMHGVAPQGIVTAKSDMDTAKAVQAAMQKLMDDGTYMKILKAWGVESGAIDKAEINPHVDD